MTMPGQQFHLQDVSYARWHESSTQTAVVHFRTKPKPFDYSWSKVLQLSWPRTKCEGKLDSDKFQKDGDFRASLFSKCKMDNGQKHKKCVRRICTENAFRCLWNLSIYERVRVDSNVKQLSPLPLQRCQIQRWELIRTHPPTACQRLGHFAPRFAAMIVSYAKFTASLHRKTMVRHMKPTPACLCDRCSLDTCRLLQEFVADSSIKT